MFIRIGNLTSNSIDLDLSNLQYVKSPNGAEATRTKVCAGDVLISITANLGSVAVVPVYVKTAYISQHLALARPKNHPMFYASAYLEAHRELYYQKLRAVSQKRDWNGWIAFFLTAILEQAQTNTRKTREILELYEQMKQDVPQITRSQYAISVLDTLFEQPIFSRSAFIRRSQIPEHSARRILDALKNEGRIRVLRSGRGSRAAVLIFPALIAIAQSGI